MTLTRPTAAQSRALTFAEAAELHLDDVYGYLLYLARDRETAEDLASSTFEKALRLWGRFDPSRGQRSHLAARHRADDRTRLVSRRGPTAEARGSRRRTGTRRRGIRRGSLAGPRRRITGAQRRRARSDRAADRPRPRWGHRRPRARNQPDRRLDTALPGAQTTRGKGDRASTSAEIVRELRASRPAAPHVLRARVEAIAASTPPAPRPTIAGRLLSRRRALLVAIPVAAALAVASAGVIGVVAPSDPADQSLAVRNAAAPESSPDQTYKAGTEAAGGAGTALDSSTATTPGPTTVARSASPRASRSR